MSSKIYQNCVNHFPGERTILLATNYLYSWTGSETLILTLIEGLQEYGFKLTVYARYLNHAWAVGLCGRDTCLTDDLESLRTQRFDLAHVQHSTCLMDVRAMFPTLPIVFSSLGVLPFLEQPAPFDCGIAQYLAISEEVQAKLIAHGVPSNRIEIVRNLVNESRFAPGEPIRSKPERILVISNKMDDARKLIVRTAAHAVGATIRFIGGADGVTPQIQLVDEINAADIVVSLGRGVVEAMLCGRVPLVFDIHGGDGLLTPDNLDELGICNFSGRYRHQEYTVNALVVEFEKYRPEFGERLRDIAKKKFGLTDNLPRLLKVYVNATKTSLDYCSVQKNTIAFCSSLAREELLHSKLVQSQLKSQLQLDWQARVGQLTAEQHRIKHTVSWQITKPLRLMAFLWRMMKRLTLGGSR